MVTVVLVDERKQFLPQGQRCQLPTGVHLPQQLLHNTTAVMVQYNYSDIMSISKEVSVLYFVKISTYFHRRSISIFVKICISIEVSVLYFLKISISIEVSVFYFLKKTTTYFHRSISILLRENIYFHRNISVLLLENKIQADMNQKNKY